MVTPREPGSALSQSDPHIFICYSSKDEAVAREIVEFLEGQDIACWISCRDVPPGGNYQETIVQALEAARGIVFLFSEASSRSGEIKKELSMGSSMNVPVFPVRLSPIAPSGALRYELSIRQWVDLFPNRQHALGKLAQTIQRVIDSPPAADGDEADERPTSANAPIANSAPASRAPGKKHAPAAAPPPETPAPVPHAPIVASGTQEFEAIRTLLARHIGPIAKVLVQKAATEATTPDEFCERLAAHVTTASERPSFVKAVLARIPAK